MENNTQKNPLNKKKIVLFIVYSIVAICLFMTVLSINDLDAISKQLEAVKIEYVFYAFLMIMAFVVQSLADFIRKEASEDENY